MRLIDFFNHFKTDSKFTGGFYEGPDVKLYLTSEGANFKFEDLGNTTLLAPAPIKESGEISTTHAPGNWTLGGSVGPTVGAGGASVSGAFSFSYTLPTTSVTTVEEEMPVSYTSSGNVPIWNYSLTCDYANVYTNKLAGFNGTFHADKIPAISKDEVETSQMVTFAVYNTKKGLGEKKAILNADVNFKCHQVPNSPFHKKHSTIANKVSFAQEMPEVYRFFEKYKPAPSAMDADADAQNWSNLESLLLTNVNYAAFKDDAMTIGAVTEEKLTPTAQAVWEETIRTLIKQYNGRVGTSCGYTVGMVDSDGDYLPIGLQIKPDSTWTMVDVK